MSRTKSIRFHLRTALLALAIAASVCLIVFALWTPNFKLKLEPVEIAPELGLAYTAHLHFASHRLLRIPTDEPASNASNLELAEDGKTLGPGHALHDTIRSQGAGRYSHWAGSLLFSSGDGSDPRVNGRNYSVRVQPVLVTEVWAAVLLADILAVFFFRKQIAAFVARCANASISMARAGASALMVAGIDRPQKPSHLRKILLSAGVAATAAVLLLSWFAPRFEFSLEKRLITPELGVAFTVPLNLVIGFPFYVPTDQQGSTASRLQLLENGRLLGPAHSSHADIRDKGGGRFSHWGDYLYFSTSDGTDPRTNGRTYHGGAHASISREVWVGIVLLDVLVVLILRFWLRELLARYWRALGIGAALVAIGGMSLLAVGTFGVVNPATGPPKNASLVLAVVGHTILACVITMAQWSMGAGVARFLLPKRGTSYAQIVLLGFPISLALLAVLATIALIVPYGRTLAPIIWVACLLPLTRWPIETTSLRSLRGALPAFLALSFTFGCWMSLHWHGPTDAIPGAPSGDQIFYSSAVWALAAHPVGWPNLGNEGEFYPYTNFLISAIGAGLLPLLPIDGFLFVGSSTAMAILGSGLALHAYLSDRPPLRLVSLESLVLAIALAAAGRTPSWLVISPPVAFVVPLAVCVWFWATLGRRSTSAASVAIISSIVGSALSKVMSAGTLAPLALAQLAPHLRHLPRKVQIGLLILLTVAAAYVAYMLFRFLPFFADLVRLGMTSLGPRSYDSLTNWGYDLYSAWPFVAQDAGMVLMMVLAFRFLERLEALALIFGLILVLVYPFLTLVNLICVAIVLALAIIGNAAGLRQRRVLVLLAFLLVAAPMIFTDEAGLPSGLLWAAIAATVPLVAIDSVATSKEAAWRPWPLALAVLLVVVTALGLVASARGTLILGSGWPGGADLTPAVRDIWRAVREQTPRDALVFTDQTGREIRFLRGWNTYALHGQRQVFISSWHQSGQLQANPVARDERLAVNDAVLSGKLEPTAVKTSRPYGSHFAVVSAGKLLAPQWRKQYANEQYVLYRWNP